MTSIGSLWRKLKTLQSSRSGATAIEYGLIMGLMTLVMVGALASTGNATSEKWNGVAEKAGEAHGGGS